MQNTTTLSSNQRPGAQPPTAAPQQFVASDWKPFPKNSLIGFFTLELPSGVRIRECCYHLRDGKSWVAMPGKPWKKSDGSISYITLIEFADKQVQYEFSCLAVAAIEQLLLAATPGGAS